MFLGVFSRYGMRVCVCDRPEALWLPGSIHFGGVFAWPVRTLHLGAAAGHPAVPCHRPHARSGRRMEGWNGVQVHQNRQPRSCHFWDTTSSCERRGRKGRKGGASHVLPAAPFSNCAGASPCDAEVGGRPLADTCTVAPLLRTASNAGEYIKNWRKRWFQLKSDGSFRGYVVVQVPSI